MKEMRIIKRREEKRAKVEEKENRSELSGGREWKSNEGNLS
jgi:hypothetical protein